MARLIMPAMRMHVKPAACWVILQLWCATALAWGPTGHRIVGEIADAHLCDGARRYVEPLLAGTTLANAGVWADAIRDEPQWRHTRPWHYLNVGDGESIATARRRSDDNVLAAIERTGRELADVRLPVERRAEALRFFVHFVADVHQPLHVGRAGDHGGNDIEVRVGRTVRNLHSVWDAEALLRREALDYREQAVALGQAAAGLGSAREIADPDAWAGESRALWPVVYGFRAPPDGPVRLSGAYLDAAREVIHRRLGLAGLRLAARLNAIGCLTH